jgi:hypothetical protein
MAGGDRGRGEVCTLCLMSEFFVESSWHRLMESLNEMILNDEEGDDLEDVVVEG